MHLLYIALTGWSKTIIKNATMDTADALFVKKIKTLRQSRTECGGRRGRRVWLVGLRYTWLHEVKLALLLFTGVISHISIITLMIIENRPLWLARSFALSRYIHRAAIITLKASSFQNGSQICWCFGVWNCSKILFSRIIIKVIIIKQFVAWGDQLLISIYTLSDLGDLSNLIGSLSPNIC